MVKLLFPALVRGVAAPDFLFFVLFIYYPRNLPVLRDFF